MLIPYEHPYREAVVVVVVWGPVYDLRVSNIIQTISVLNGECLHFLPITLLYVDTEAGPNEGRLHHWLPETVLTIPNHSPSTHCSGHPSTPVRNHSWLATRSFCLIALIRATSVYSTVTTMGAAPLCFPSCRVFTRFRYLCDRKAPP